MAEISSDSGKKVSTKVDMTPMVDLAFLLITFFMLTTTFSKPQTLTITVPAKPTDNTTMKVRASKTITVVLAEKNKIYYYQGTTKPDIQVTDFSEKGIRKVLLKKRNEIGKDVSIIIKAKKKSKYKNLVDFLDELAITGISRYAITEIRAQDLALIADSKK